MRAELILVLALLAVPLVGCLATEEGPSQPPPQEEDDASDDGPAWIQATALEECVSSCFEPNLATGPNGTVYVVEGSGFLARSTDGGGTFASLGEVPLPSQNAEGASQADGLVDVAPDGTLYYSALLRRGASVVGLQVAASPDGGDSWPTNTFVSIEDGDGDPVRDVDRQWLAFGKGETVYLSYAQQVSAVVECTGTGLWVARSDDGGGSFSSFERAAPYEERDQCGQAGPPLVLDEGLLALPHWTNRPSPASMETDRGVDLAVSEDGGQTFRQEQAVTADGGWFPVLAASDEQLHLAFEGAGDTVLTTSASDPSGPWSGPRAWSDEANVSVTSPWIARGPEGTVGLAWATETDGGSVLHVRSAQATGDGLEPAGPVLDVAEIEANAGNPANTHFADIAFLPDGDVATVWAPGDGTVEFARIGR